MSVCLCVSAYMSHVSMRWDKKGAERSPVQAGHIEGSTGRLCVPFSVMGLTDLHSNSLHRPPPPLYRSRLCLPQSALSNAHLTSRSKGRVSYCLHTHPPYPGSTPPCSLDTGAGEGWWGEALKAGDCLGELGDRAPLCPPRSRLNGALDTKGL